MTDVSVFVTGTATICVFDPEALKHRLADYSDWWSDEDEEIKEINAGNVLFVALGSDGRYEVEVRPNSPFDEPGVSAVLKCPSGNVFVGPGEDVTGGDLEPTGRRTTGRFTLLNPGRYEVKVCRLGPWRLGVSLLATTSAEENGFEIGPSLAD